jgi:hypothetical protein
MSEEVRVPAVRRSPIVASGNRRLDVWIYRDENSALRAAAELAMSCGTRNRHYLSTLSQPTTRDSAYMVDSDAVQITNYLVFLAG